MSNAVYEVITNRIIASLDQGVIPWRTPWTTSAPKNLISKKPYRGVNIFLLNASRFSSPWWLTYNQCTQKKGQVKKGEHGTPVIFWKMFDNGVGANGKPKKNFVLRYYTVFNSSQCEGLEVPTEVGKTSLFTPIEACERIVMGYTENGPPVEHGGDKASYSPMTDIIHMPEPESFETPEAYYCTRFHEMVHSTGAEKRLARDGITHFDKFGSHQYSFEELIAECGASYLCGEAGVVDTTIDNSTAYIQNWVRKLRNETKWIVQAGGKAANAADFILGHKVGEEEEVE
jgi:antirestriction protein ArdC